MAEWAHGSQRLKITIMVEGKTELAFKSHLHEFLKGRMAGRHMPKLDFFPCTGRVYKEAKLQRTVKMLLQSDSAAVIALTDVYTGTKDFSDAADAKQKMQEWVGDEPKFYPHAAQYDFEAWLLPYWSDIQRLAGHNRTAPSGAPEKVNHNRPPSRHIIEIFEIGTCRDSYSKVRDANAILRGKDLAVAAAQCPELKAFLNTILTLAGGDTL